MENIETIEPIIHNSSDFITTFSGKEIYFNNIKSEDIDERDVAHALSMLCRFNGHCKHFYSVAQHSIITSLIVEPEFALEAFCHDFAEYIVGDLVTPVKRNNMTYKTLEDNIFKVISKKFKLKYPFPKEIKKADIKAFEYEWIYVMGNENTKNIILPNNLSPNMFKEKSMKQIENEFLDRFHELTNSKKAINHAIS